MKISMESAVNNYINTAKVGMNNNKTAQLQGTGKKFDQIMIDSNSRRKAEEKLAEAAKKEVTGSVYQKTPDEKIANLKQQVAQGLYNVDPEAVAAKILLLGGKA